MSAAEVLIELVEAEVVLWLDGDRLRFRAPEGAVTGELRERVATCRAALVALVKAGAVLPATRSDWPEEVAFDFEERAGICEFEGELPRDQAEREADKCLRLAHTRSFIEAAALMRPP